jgi:archaea-specific RecJ-like exonuclease
VVVLDNGSTKGDEAGLRLLKSMRVPAIVIDHHPIDIDVEGDTLRKVHLSPYLVGGTGDFTAGMLSAELASMLNPEAKVVHLAALSGIGDKVSGPAIEGYLKKAELAGFGRSKLQKLYLALDYLISFRMDNWQLLNELLLGENEPLISVFYEESRRLREKRLRAIKAASSFETLKQGQLAVIELEEVLSGWGYPPPGRSVGLLFSELRAQAGIVLGFASSYLIIRGELPGMGVNGLIKVLQQRFPEAQIDGGGHDVAGTLSFLPKFKAQVKKAVLEIVRAGFKH